ncbi:MAG: MASE1 domain-containing protein [Polyangiales bacterium]
MRTGRAAYVREGLLLAVTYFVSGYLGLRLATIGGAVTLFWPPTGLSIAVLTARGLGLFPFVMVGSFAVNLVAMGDVPTSLLVCVGNTLEAVLGATLLRGPFAIRPDFGRQRDVLALGAATALASLVAAAIGATALRMRGVSLPFEQIARVWWMGDAASGLAVAPAVLTWLAPETEMRRVSRRFLVLFGLGVAVSIAFVFLIRFAEPRTAHPFLSLPFGFVVVAALRLGPRGATTTLLAVAAVAVVGTADGRGPYADADPQVSMRLVWSGIAIASVAMLLLSSVVAERVRAQAAHEAVQARFAAAFEHAPVGIALVDLGPRFVLVNSRLAEILGRRPDELVGTSVDDVLGRGVRREIAHALSDAIAAGAPYAEASVEVVGAHGVKHRCDVRFTVLSEADEVVGFVAHVEDVTDRDKDRRERAALERRVVEAQRMESIGSLAGGVAHDFNNMLQAILGNIDLARAAIRRGQEAERYLVRASDAGDRAARLTQQLLTFSRRRPAELEVLDLAETVESVSSMIRRLLPESIHLELELPPKPVWVRADAGQVEQVVMNLVVNARDAMPSGGRVVVSVAELVGGPKPVAELRVEDEGEGIAPAVRQRMFDPFFTTKPLGKGTGLGLSVVYGIVTDHGGTVDVDSTYGKGAAFVVRLPMTGPPERRERPRSERPKTETGVERILVVEDEEVVRNVVHSILEDAGYDVVVASNGKEALELLAQDAEVDLVVLDVVMPVLGGRPTYERLRVLHPTIPVLFTSGYADDELGPDFLEHEKIRILRKPYDRSTLLARVRERLDSAAAEAPSDSVPPPA